MLFLTHIYYSALFGVYHFLWQKIFFPSVIFYLYHYYVDFLITPAFFGKEGGRGIFICFQSPPLRKKGDLGGFLRPLRLKKKNYNPYPFYYSGIINRIKTKSICPPLLHRSYAENAQSLPGKYCRFYNGDNQRKFLTT